MKEHITVKQYHKIMKTSGDWHWPKTGGEMRDFVEKYNEWKGRYDETVSSSEGD